MKSVTEPLEFPIVHVQSDWIDYNGHMNVSYYVLAFDRGVDALLEKIGLGPEYIKTQNASFFTLQINVNYLQEVKEGDPLRLSCQLLDFDQKRMHYYLEMYHADEGYLAATAEQIGVHVDLNSRRSSPFPEQTIEKLRALMEEHKSLPHSEYVGKKIGIRRK